jgi:hypothetical protein
MSAQPSTGLYPKLDADILKLLPDYIAAVVIDYAANTGLSEAQVVELALAHFLNLEASTFADIDPASLKSYAEMKARLDFLESMWKAAKAKKLSTEVIQHAVAMGW